MEPVFGKRSEVSFDEILEIESCPCQRNEDIRAGRVAASMKRGVQPTIYEMAAATLPDGRKFLLNGHTRRYIWNNFHKFGIVAPKSVCLTLYSVETIDEVKNIYYSFDSEQAVEKSSDKIQGSLRELNLDLKTDTLKKGCFAKALQYAVESYSSNHRSLSNLEKIKMFSDCLVILDRLQLPKLNATFWAAALMLVQKYKSNYRQLTSVLNALKDLRDEKNGGVNDDGKCGLYIIKSEWLENSIFPIKGSSANSMPAQIGFVLYYLHRYISNRRVKKMMSTKSIDYTQFYKEYFNQMNTKSQIFDRCNENLADILSLFD